MPIALVFDGTCHQLHFGSWDSLIALARAEHLKIWKLWDGVGRLASKFLRRVLVAWIRQYSETGNGSIYEQAE